MLRRDFLGSVLGLFAGTQVPFLIEEAKPKQRKTDCLTKTKQFIRLLELDYAELLKCQMFIILDDKTRIWAPGILSVSKQITEDGMVLDFRSESIIAQKEITIYGAGMVDDQGYFVKEEKFNRYYLKKDDQLNLSYKLKGSF